MRRDEAGSIRLNLGEQDAGISSFGPEIFERLARPPKPNGPLGLIRRVVVRDATLVLDDRQSGRRWRANRVDVSFERNQEGFTGDLSLALQTGTSEPELHVSCRYTSRDKTLDCGAELGAIEPAALASAAPEFAFLVIANGYVNGDITKPPIPCPQAGRIYRLGRQHDPANPTVWELVPGYDLAGPGENINAMPNLLGPVRAFLVGKGFLFKGYPPTNSGVFSGYAMDIAAYPTTIMLKSR